MKIVKKLKLLFVLLMPAAVAFGQFVFEREIRPAPVHKSPQFSSITVSQFGDIYLLESKACEIYRLNAAGEVLTVNGGFGWDEGRFDTPLDINIASGLDLLVADYNNHRIVRFDRELNYLSTYPDPNSGFELSYPRSVVLTNLGDIFILSDENAEIVRLQLSGNSITTFAGVAYGDYALAEPVLIRMNDRGIINVLEEGGRIVQFDRFGAPVGRLKVSAESRILTLITVDEDLIVTLGAEPALMLYAAAQKRWTPLIIGGLPTSARFESGFFRNDELYLLASGGRIFVCRRLAGNGKN